MNTRIPTPILATAGAEAATPADWLSALVDGQWRWASEVAALQAAWLTSMLSLQGQLLTTGWPAWMIWHNGTEQLA